MTSSTLQPSFCAALYFFRLFIAGFLATLALVEATASSKACLSAQGHGKKALLYFILALCLFFGGTFVATHFPGCTDCCLWVLNNSDKLSKEDTLFRDFFFVLPGFFAAILLESRKEFIAVRALHRFIRGCVTDGSMRYAYEITSLEEPAVHDLITSMHNLWPLAAHAIKGEIDSPVYIVMNMSAEQAIQKLQQHKLITKNGYKRLPAPKNRHMIPPGGSVLQFYYNAEYVRIWG